ncbi:MAG: 2'-5' RNA ligase family protein [Terriglobia bacterium]|jgi:2'-5' RNA ligase|nr:2'-5' RNA ligase family protein [Terriglobia bacterium]
MPELQYALVAYVRNALGEFVENLRRELHPEFAHLPAHVSILPPRPLHGSEADAVEQLVQLCRNVDPFEISMGGVEAFLPTTPTVFLQISYAAYKLRELHDLVNSGALEFREPLPYMPHLTIAKVSSPERAREVYCISRDRWDRYEGKRRTGINSLTFVRGTGTEWTDIVPIELGQRAPARVR